MNEALLEPSLKLTSVTTLGAEVDTSRTLLPYSPGRRVPIIQGYWVQLTLPVSLSGESITIPERLGSIQKAGQKTLPASLDEWSQPLPEEQWAKPSAELTRLSAEVRQRHAQQPKRPITAIFAEVYAEEARLSN